MSQPKIHLWRWLGVSFAIISMILHTANAENVTNDLRPNLTGIVRNEAGQPVSNVVVFIYTAGPKQGPSTFCPSCYADCRKRATTDAQGNFTIASLDPNLLFRVLVAGGGWEPKFVAKVDPAEKPLPITLEPQLVPKAANQKLQGRVVDAQSQPVAGAVVSIRGVTRAEGTQFGGNDDVDQVAVSDGDGKFLITSRTPFAAAGVDVEARKFAKGIFQHLTTGGEIHTLKLTEGATLAGRVVQNGKPLAGVEVNVSGANRESSVYIGDFSIATDANGKFLFANLPPQTEYVLCGTMDSLGERGCIPAKNVRLNDDGQTIDAGDLAIQPAFVLAGQIRLTDGTPLPAHEHVQLGRQGPWDSSQVETDETGHFKFVGVPPEQVTLGARVPGHRLSLRNASLDRFNSFWLIGRIVTNKTDLIMEFEPGKNLPRDNDDWESANAARQEPLHGAEGGNAPPPNGIKVIGTVVDAGTRKPLPTFTVTEGRKNSYNNRINWLLTRATSQSNGTFTVYLSRRPQPPAISIAAEGYLTKNSDVITTGETNFVFALTKGSGSAGVILEPDGDPATNVTVYLADAGQNGVYAGRGNQLMVREEIYPGTRRTKTDGTGHFSFPALPDAYAVIVLDTNGFAEVRAGDLATNAVLRLQRYARVEGQLFIGSQPGSNETVNLDRALIPYADYPRDFPPLNLYLSTQTDADGKFVFERVPPIAVSVCHQPKVRDRSEGVIPQSQTTGMALAPAETRRITLGGQGRLVIGRLNVTGYDGQIDFRAEVQSIETIATPPAGLPDLMATGAAFAAKLRSVDSDEARKAALGEHQKEWEDLLKKTRDFYQTPAGLDYYFARRRYALNFATNGAFRIEDVPGGKYKLRLELHEPGGSQPFNQPLVGALTKEFMVPDSPGGRGNEPFDLGVLELTARNNLKIGKPAPDFAIKTLDGQGLKLADYQGKFLLVDFWAAWCGPCVAETPNLKATWDAFKNEPRFAMVSLSLDPDASEPKKFTAKNEIGWTQGFLGEWSKSDVPDRWAVEGIPAIFLVGPDGKILARDLRGEAIKAAVASALGH